MNSVPTQAHRGRDRSMRTQRRWLGLLISSIWLPLSPYKRKAVHIAEDSRGLILALTVSSLKTLINLFVPQFADLQNGMIRASTSGSSDVIIRKVL